MVAQLRTVSGAEIAAAAAPALEEQRAPLWRHLVFIGIGTLLLLGAILADKRPTVFSDTDDYYSQAHAIVRDAAAAIFKHNPIITKEMIEDHWLHDDNGDEEPIHNEEGARSPYYGLFLYALDQLGTIWLMAAVQAGMVAGFVYGLWRLVAPNARAWTYVAMMAGLAVGSPLPFVAGFAVPDAMTGVAALGGIVFLLYADRLTLFWRFAVWLAIAFAFNSHTSHILTGAAVTICAAPLLVAFKAPLRPLLMRSGLIAAAAAAAMAANAAYAFMVHMRTGDDLHSPPFLSIRVIADGPGRAYLRSECSKSAKWALCRFRNLPLQDSNTLMWSDDYKVGVFNVSDFQLRDRMEREDIPFTLSVLKFDPLGQAAASLKNWWLQFFSISMNEVLIDPYYYLRDAYWGHTHLRQLILGPGWCGKGPHACKPTFTEDVLRWEEWVFNALAAAFLLWRLTRSDVRHILARRDFADAKTQAVLVVALLLLAVIMNAGVCGVISGVFGRYQARIVWLIPMAAALTAAACGLRPRARPHLEVVTN